MDLVMKGLQSKLQNDSFLTSMVRKDDIRVWGGSIDEIPPGAEWPYIIIKDGGIETPGQRSFQKEELLTGEIYICTRDYSPTGAPQLLDENKGAIPLARHIIDLLEDDWNHQWALVGHYGGRIPISINRINSPLKSESFTPKGATSNMDRITSRILVAARYYRYSTRSVAVA